MSFLLTLNLLLKVFIIIIIIRRYTRHKNTKDKTNLKKVFCFWWDFSVCFAYKYTVDLLTSEGLFLNYFDTKLKIRYLHNPSLLFIRGELSIMIPYKNACRVYFMCPTSFFILLNHFPFRIIVQSGNIFIAEIKILIRTGMTATLKMRSA